MNLEYEKMDFPPFSKKKNFLSWHMKIHQGGVLTQKIFFLLEMNIEDEKMDFSYFWKKKFFKVGTWKSIKGSIDKSLKMDFPLFLKKKNFLKLAHENPSRGSIDKKNFFLLEMNLEYVDFEFQNYNFNKE